MSIKNIFKITPIRLLSFIILYIVLWIFHSWCSPYAWTGGAILPNGEVGGGLETKCGFFSEWIWNNHAVYNVYTNINGWHILIITILVIIIGNFVTEICKNKKHNNTIKS